MQREKTLLTAFLLSAWGPLATGIALIMNRSSTQFADFIRRTVELTALFISWFIFRYIHRNNIREDEYIMENEYIGEKRRVQLERYAHISVSVTLGSAGAIILTMALINFTSSSTPGNKPWMGLGIAFLGAMVNIWFWRRYSILNLEEPNIIIDSQKRLYRSKSVLDICIMLVLLTAILFPATSVAKYVDFFGSIFVALYLFISIKK